MSKQQTTKMATGWANKQTIKEQINGHKNKQTNAQTTH